MSERQEVDPFVAAFEQLSALGDKPPPAVLGKPEETPAPEPEAKPTEEASAPAAEETPVPAAEETPAPVAGETPAPEPEAKPAPPAETDDDLLRRLGSLLKNAPAATPEPEQKTEQPAPAPMPEIYSEDEKKVLQEYVKDWPEVARAEALARRAEHAMLAGYIFNQVQQVLAPMMETVATLADRGALQEIKSAVPDYSEDTREAVIQWAGSQPSYLKAAYERVIKEGTTEEVLDLLERYKRETAPAAAPAPTPKPASRKEPELPPAVKQAADALAPVGSKRSAVTQGLDPNDFGAAFAEFADKV